MSAADATTAGSEHYDVIVVGAGVGGIYAAYRFRRQGLSVLGIEGGGDFGGVWYHNRYPGARVDVDSVDYCYHFSEEVARRWRWTERYASQPELLRYLEFVVDTHDLRPLFRFDNWVTGARWQPHSATYRLTTSAGDHPTCRHLVMATGNLSRARRPPFTGLDRFRGEWVQTSHWPHREVALDGRRLGIVGTGSTGVQAIPILAERGRSLTVFQRTANYVVPARNRPLRRDEQAHLADRIDEERAILLETGAGTRVPIGRIPSGELTEAERLALLERQWHFGGQGMTAVFSDQGTDWDANGIASEFVRNKIRATVADPGVAAKLLPTAYPIGSRRLALDTGYYETYNRENVTLVDVGHDPIVEITETGIRTQGAHHELDLIVFALGFHAFTGSIDAANIRNDEGRSPTDGWARGPQTMLGLMTVGFPNLYLPTGPGSPSVLANLILGNELSIDWIGDAIAFLDERGLRTIEPTPEAQAAWTAHVAEVSAGLLRLQVDNYMVHVNADRSRVFIPYAGGLKRYAEHLAAVQASGYDGFVLR